MRTRARLFRLSLTLAVAFLWLGFVAPVLATDGVLEINGTCASAGCFSGDPPGYPVVITQSGSYRLTGNLAVVIPSLSILDIRADHVTIDLNGFALLGPQVCDVGSCGSSGSGYGIVSYNIFPTPENTTVLNGTISGFNECLVLAAKRIHVQRLSISHCTAAGLHVGDDGLVLDNRVSNVSKSGIHMGANTAFRDNVVTNADLSGTGTRFAFEGGRAVGGNVCVDGSCSRVPKRRYYLTPGFFNGDQADEPGTCSAGFHFASLWEIHEPSALQYDTALGRGTEDSGEGPPSDQAFGWGWIRTGFSNGTGTPGGGGEGQVNCTAWTLSSGGAGTVAMLERQWTQGHTIPPWNFETLSCGQGFTSAWCVED